MLQLSTLSSSSDLSLSNSSAWHCSLVQLGVGFVQYPNSLVLQTVLTYTFLKVLLQLVARPWGLGHILELQRTVFPTKLVWSTAWSAPCTGQAARCSVTPPKPLSRKLSLGRVVTACAGQGFWNNATSSTTCRLWLPVWPQCDSLANIACRILAGCANAADNALRTTFA